MATKVFNGVIRLRKDTEGNFLANSNLILADGEVSLVETARDGLRIKIGDGQTKWSALSYLDNINNVVIRGFYHEGQFYYDSNYQHLINGAANKIYIDISTAVMYHYDTNSYSMLNPLPIASATVAGISKIYSSSGTNEDGSCTQKFITTSFSELQSEVDSKAHIEIDNGILKIIQQ